MLRHGALNILDASLKFSYIQDQVRPERPLQIYLYTRRNDAVSLFTPYSKLTFASVYSTGYEEYNVLKE